MSGVQPGVDSPFSLPDRWFHQLSRAAALAVVGVGAVVLVGWAFDARALTGVLPGFATMKANTALTFLLAGTALWLSIPDGRRGRVGRGAAAFVLLAGLLTLAQDVFLLDLGIDEVLVRAGPPDPAAPHPGRMAPATAASFVLLGLALLLLDAPPIRGWVPAHPPALLALATALIALAGYAYGVENLYHTTPYSSVAVHTAAAFFVLALGVLAARPRRGVMALVASRTSGGMIVRRQLPVFMLALLALGSVRLAGERAGYYGTAFGTALMVVGTGAVFAVLVVWTGWAAHCAGPPVACRRVLVRDRAELLRATLASIGDGVITTDVEGRVVFQNAVAEALTGWAQDEAAGRPVGQVFHILNAETRRPVENPVRRVLGEGLVVGLANHTVLIARDGTERPIDDSAAPIRTGGGPVGGAVLVFRDVTERYAAEEALRRERTLLRTLIDTLPDAIWTKDAAGRFVVSNRAHDAMVGASNESEVAAKTGFDFHPPDLARQYHEDDLRVLQHGETLFNKEELVRRPAGPDRWHLVIKTPLRDRAGGITGLVGISRNIQDRKEAEETLRASESLFRSAFEDTNVAMVITDLDHRFVRVNAAFAGLFGYTRDEMLARSMPDITHPADLAESHARREHLLAGAGHFVQQKRYLHRDGRVLWGVTNVSLVRDAGGRPVLYVGQVQDVTAQKQAESELRVTEGRFQAFFDATNVAMVEVSPDARYLRANAAFYRMFGYTPEELPGLTVADAVFPEERDAVLAQYGRVGQGETTAYEADRRYRRKDGSALWRG